MYKATFPVRFCEGQVSATGHDVPDMKLIAQKDEGENFLQKLPEPVRVPQANSALYLTDCKSYLAQSLNNGNSCPHPAY